VARHEGGQLLEDLLQIKENVLEPAIKMGEVLQERLQEPTPEQKLFHLTCMLQEQHQEEQLEAAWSLMELAISWRHSRRHEDLGFQNTMNSVGAMDSLLSLFSTQTTSYNVQVVAALAVAYMLLFFPEDSMSPRVGFRVIHALRLLSKTGTVTWKAKEVTKEDLFNASVVGIFQFWNCQIVPILTIMQSETSSADPATTLGINAITSWTHYPSQPQEESAQLLEMTVILIIQIAEAREHVRSDALLQLIVQLCAEDIAQPIAFQQCILNVLVSWIQSTDSGKICSAAVALRHLAFFKMSYMAGLIHSQIIEKGVLEGIINMWPPVDFCVRREIQIQVAHVIYVLCMSPHTRASVVKAEAVPLLVQFIYDYVSSEECAYLAGSALSLLAAEEITKATRVREDHLQLELESDKKIVE